MATLTEATVTKATAVSASKAAVAAVSSNSTILTQVRNSNNNVGTKEATRPMVVAANNHSTVPALATTTTMTLVTLSLRPSLTTEAGQALVLLLRGTRAVLKPKVALVLASRVILSPALAGVWNLKCSNRKLLSHRLLPYPDFQEQA